MSHFYQNIHIERLKEVYRRLPKEIVIESVPLVAECAVTPEPVPYEARESLNYAPINVGDKWGDVWDCGWFHLKGEIPKAWKGAYVTLNLEFTGEALIYDAEGCPDVALTNGSVFDGAYNKDMAHLYKSCKGGEALDFWVETGANNLFGVTACHDPDWIEDKSKLHGTFPSTVNRMRICRFDYDKWQLWIDLEVILRLVDSLPEGSARRVQVLRIASRALDALPPERGGAAKAREAMREIFELGTDPATVDVSGIGHAHIDTAWLWPVRETIRKVGRTFASQIGLIARYPGYKFGASQAQLYQFCKDYYPALYKKVKKAISAGDWEVQGGMWVEADCNIPSGESLVRQLLLGRNYFRDEFGIEVKNLWLPDVFGYSGNLPQILKSAGVDYFLTQKISWNRYNKFPHNTFIWQGIDGSEVFAHFPPEDDYNSQVNPDQLRKHETNNAEAGLVQDAICLFGIGNGGGGPKEEHVERGLRCHNLNGCPRFTFGFSQNAMERMAKSWDDLDTWFGELYFEMHRGTYTSQADIKLWNRRAEEALRAAEMLCAAAGVDNYPHDALDQLWKDVLINQFHDIIPGSSIRRVYAEAVPQLKNVVAECKRLQEQAAAKYMTKKDDALTLFNPSSTAYKGTVKLPGDRKSATLDGAPVPVQREADEYIAWVDVPENDFVTLTLSADEPEAAVTTAVKENTVLENDEVRYVISPEMKVVSAFDKTEGVEFVTADRPGNILALYDDHPREYDAWDFEEYFSQMKTHDPEITSIELVSGPVRTGVMAYIKLGKSMFVQTAWLGKTGKRLDFVTDVNWSERHKIARVDFPLNVHAQEARFEIQYGTVARTTHDNTKWQYAQFESLAHRYADMSEPTFGVALLNDSKYGYSAKNGVMSMTLLRAPTYPDPVCDIGQHHFVYSLLPHAGSLACTTEVTANAAMLNQRLEKFPGFAKTDDARLPVSFDGDGIELAVVKRAEKEDSLVVRLVETRGRHASGTLSTTAGTHFTECQTSEWHDVAETVAAPALIRFKPFEIKTFKIK